MAKINGRFHEVRAWDGVPGVGVDREIGLAFQAAGAPVTTYWSYDTNAGVDVERFRVPTPLAFLWPDVELIKWAVKAFDPTELRVIFKLQDKDAWLAYVRKLRAAHGDREAEAEIDVGAEAEAATEEL